MANTTSLFRRAVRCFLLLRGELLTAALAAVLCTASYSFSIWHNSRGAANASILGSAPVIAGGMFCGGGGDSSVLDFEAHHSAENAGLSVSMPAKRRALREAPPAGYRSPFPWRASRGVVWAGNSARGTDLAEAGERWARVDGDRLRFTDSRAVGAYSDAVGRLVPAPVCTALDVGDMRAGSWAAHVLSRGILAVCAAPWAASEDARGVPAVLAARVPGRCLPYPPRAFDMVHCGGCLVPWHLHGGLFLIEVDRVLRPGGYWVHPGAPGNGIASAASRMCWKKVAEQRDIAVWQKSADHTGCDAGIKFCSPQNHGAAWDSTMEACITPLPAASAPERRGVTAEALSRDGGGALAGRRGVEEEGEVLQGGGQPAGPEGRVPQPYRRERAPRRVRGGSGRRPCLGHERRPGGRCGRLRHGHARDDLRARPRRRLPRLVGQCRLLQEVMISCMPTHCSASTKTDVRWRTSCWRWTESCGPTKP